MINLIFFFFYFNSTDNFLIDLDNSVIYILIITQIIILKFNDSTYLINNKFFRI